MGHPSLLSRYELGSADLTELPGAVVVPPGLLPPLAGGRPKFYELPNKDAPPATKSLEELLPKEQRERWYLMPSLWDADRPAGAGLGDDDEEEEEDEEGGDAAVRGPVEVVHPAPAAGAGVDAPRVGDPPRGAGGPGCPVLRGRHA